MMICYQLWNEPQLEEVTIEYYKPIQRGSDIAVLIFPGGGYRGREPHEGIAYAQLLNTWGISAFVVEYRCRPNDFPAPLQDARRAVQFVRSHAHEWNINKDKIIVMGSSAGGHLAALLSTYQGQLNKNEDVLDKESFIPNGQILCYPVISSDESIIHKGSYECLLGKNYAAKDKYSPDMLVSECTPPAFIWHTEDDSTVSCLNSFRYAECLIAKKVPCELHMFPNGAHGAALAPHLPHVAQWQGLLRAWLNKYYQ